MPDPTDLTLHAIDATTLLTPELAQGRVSRQELVNLMVVTYVDAQKAKLADLATEIAQRETSVGTELVACYAAWAALLTEQLLLRVEPWRAAVEALSGLPVTVVHPIEAIVTAERDSLYSASTYRANRGHEQQDATLVGLVQGRSYGWDYPTIVVQTAKKAWEAATLPVSVNLAIHGDAAKWGIHSTNWIYVDLDLLPLQNSADETLQRLHTLYDDIQELAAVRRNRQDIVNTISDVPGLERRALAELTKQALGTRMPTLPRIGG